MHSSSQTQSGIGSSSKQVFKKLYHWPFPVVNKQRTPASQKLLDQKHQKRATVDLLEDFEEGLF